MKAIINRNHTLSTLDGVIMLTSDVYKVVFSHLKTGTARKLIDTKETLMYKLG
jgi:hypothetical protein